MVTRRGARTVRRFQMASFGLTNTGRMRPTNEDSLLIAPLPDGSGSVFAVADGLGGRVGGEVASAIAVDTVRSSLSLAMQSTISDDDLKSFVMRADAAVREAAKGPVLHEMASTLTVAVCLGRRLFVAHVGDSRCYLLRAGALRQVTDDQTLPNALLREGKISAREAAEHPRRHALTSCLGWDLEVQVCTLELRAGDKVLLCSDGLYETVPDTQIALILRRAPSPEEACRRLVDLANARGGPDNITVIVATMEAR
jgi:PPM family protein phosphatase